MTVTSVSTDEMQQYAGTYTSDQLDIVYQIRVDDGQAFVKRSFIPEEAMVFVTRDLFTIARLSIAFERDNTGQVVAFGLSAGRAKELRFVRNATNAEKLKANH